MAPANGEDDKSLYQLLSRQPSDLTEADLRRALDYAVRLFETANLMIVGLDSSGRVELFNAAAEKITEYTKDEIIGRSWFETIVPAGEYPEVRQMFARWQEGNYSQDHLYANPILTKSGKKRFIRWQNSRLGSSERFSGTISYGIDITERVLAENALSESEHQYRSLVEQSCDPIYVLEQGSMRLVLVNPAWERLLGYSSAEALSSDFGLLSIVAPESRPLILERVAQRSRALPLDPIYEFRAVTRDGRNLDLEASDTEIVWRGVQAVQGMYRDISANKEAERRLRLSDRILQRVGALVMAADSTGRVSYAGPSAEEMLGYEPAQLLGDGWWNLVHSDPEERQRQRELRAGIARGEIPLPKAPYEQLLQHRDGTSRWILWQDTLGPEGLVFGVGQDITERKRLEGQLRQAQKMEAVGRLAGGIAHDFNNLLTAIKGYSELILDSLSYADPLRKEMEEISKAGDRAANLTRQLLAFSRKQVLRPMMLDLNAVVADISKLIQRLIGEDIELVSSLQPGLGCVKADAGQIEQVILNLALNARDAMPHGGKLSIRTSDITLDKTEARKRTGMRPGRYVRLTLSDTGSGMDSQTLAHLFEPFFTTKEVGSGTGLGLSTAYGIIKQSGGYIYAVSEVGRGSTFEIYLPFVEGTPDVEFAPAHAAVQASGRETILLVEQEDLVRSLSQKILRVRGYTVLAAADGPEALAIAGLHPGPVHLLITDDVMPGMDGRELAQALGAVRPEMKILYLSARCDDLPVLNGGQNPAAASLAKPFSPLALVHKVREVLGPP